MVEKTITKTQKPAGWAFDLPRAEESQMALSFYQNLQLRLPKTAGAR